MPRVTALRFIDPQLPSLVEQPPEGKHWIHEKTWWPNTLCWPCRALIVWKKFGGIGSSWMSAARH